MAVTTNLAGADNFVLAETIGAYSDEAYTGARKLSSTALVGSNPDIDVNTETFTGQMRWFTPSTQNINVASLTDASEGQTNTYGSQHLAYIKSVRTSGGKKVNLQDLVTQQDGLAKLGRDFGELRSQDEHNAVLSILKGVAISEALNGAAAGSGSAGLGGQTFDNDPEDQRYGFYVDLGANKPVGAASTSSQGAARAEGLLNAFGMAYKDLEADWAYLVVSPEVFASLRSANLVDSDRVTEGNVNFNTIFQGKFRLIQTRASQGMSAAERTKLNTGAGVDIVGAKTSFIILPGAVAMESLAVPEATEIERKAGAYKGGGTTTIWNRWGYVMHPNGYGWNGETEDFASDATYKGIVTGLDGYGALVDAADSLATVKGTWVRKAKSALSLGILPVFHS
jgi:hypothetical protein